MAVPSRSRARPRGHGELLKLLRSGSEQVWPYCPASLSGRLTASRASIHAHRDSFDWRSTVLTLAFTKNKTNEIIIIYQDPQARAARNGQISRFDCRHLRHVNVTVTWTRNQWLPTLMVSQAFKFKFFWLWLATVLYGPSQWKAAWPGQSPWLGLLWCNSNPILRGI